jgi:uncharacterized protein (UPF0332 family)
MSEEFDKLVQTGKLSTFTPGPALVDKEMASAKSDLSDARAGFESKRFKWSTIQAYYSMFHAARALIYSREYREKSHYAISVALKALFVDLKKLDIQFVRDFLNGMNLREAADYEAEFSEEGAKTIIKAADRFLCKAEELLKIR